MAFVLYATGSNVTGFLTSLLVISPKLKTEEFYLWRLVKHEDESATGKTTTQVRANSKSSQNENIVYMIFARGTYAALNTTTYGMRNELGENIYKYGVSGRADKLEQRPQYQVNKLNRNLMSVTNGAMFDWRPMGQFNNRTLAEVYEAWLVYHYNQTYGGAHVPPGNFRPLADLYERLGRK